MLELDTKFFLYWFKHSDLLQNKSKKVPIIVDGTLF